MQLILILIVLAISYFLFRDSFKDWRRALAKIGKKGAWAAFAVVLLYLAITGKLVGAFALLGAALAYLLRIVPLILYLAPALRKLWATFKTGDAEDWQQSEHSAHSQQAGGSPGKGQMSLDKAYEVLGLKPGASKEDIVAAHRRL
jgi:hypothetical protein